MAIDRRLFKRMVECSTAFGLTINIVRRHGYYGLLHFLEGEDVHSRIQF